MPFHKMSQEVHDSLTWDFVPWLKTITKLPIIIKGLLAAEDVELALQAGVDGISVSNHGGRQLDYAPSALEVLPSIVRAVKKRVPVFMDGGVRRGTDILKALALGADIVLLGRPLLYALAVGGQPGVERALGLIKDELELAMALAGCPSLGDIGPALILPLQPHPHAILLHPPPAVWNSSMDDSNAGVGSRSRCSCQACQDGASSIDSTLNRELSAGRESAGVLQGGGKQQQQQQQQRCEGCKGGSFSGRARDPSESTRASKL